MEPASAKRKGKRAGTLAARADRHDLYQRSVQCVEAEIDFVDDTFHALRRRRARVLREDFCGTANTSCEWVRRRRGNRAIGVDLDAEVQAWGRSHNLAALGKQASHVRLVCDDVTSADTGAVDAVLAMNFSYWIFKERESLRRYFARVRDTLVGDGLLFLDAYGGSDAHREMRERTKHQDFTYIWDQAAYDPISGHMVCHIHFAFPDGSRMRRAFTYHWRLWSLPELRELLAEAGFARTSVYWQGTDEQTGEADGNFTACTRGEADPAWICYLVAEK